jgi:hypothetical protein
MRNGLILIAASLLLAAVQANANADTTKTLKTDTRPEEYGFRSSTEMASYFTVDNVEVKEVPPKFTKAEINRLYRGFPFPNPVVPPTEGSPTPTPTPAATPAPGTGPGSGPGTTPTPTATPASGTSPTPAPSATPARPTFPGAITDPFGIDSWVTIAEKIWKIIVDNQPTATVSTKRVSVLPVAQQDWQQMENWQGPLVKSYEVKGKNLLGMTVMSLTYTVAYNYGGQLNGTGAFLANATIIPSDVYVAWGFKLEVDAEVGDTINTGTKANPIPGVDIGTHWKVGSVMTKTEGRDVFFLKGNGDMIHLTAKSAAKAK